jgi:hypothetical protein
MPKLPDFHDREIAGTTFRAVDWRRHFASGVPVHQHHYSGEMKQFHVVFTIRISRTGTFIFYDDDGCVIRRHGEIIHDDRSVHTLTRHELNVRAGDRLEIAQWQFHGDWLWAGFVQSRGHSLQDDVDLFRPYWKAVQKALRRPNGPPLKTYFAASHPVRAALAIHSLILNGYRPTEVLVFGDYQWDSRGRQAVQELLPFAKIIPTNQVLETARALDSFLPSIAMSCWSAMKICVCLLYPPFEYCFLDDDVFVLDRMDEALLRFRDHDLVYAPDWNHGESYLRIWNSNSRPLATGDINTGIHLLRNRHDRVGQARRLVRNPPDGHPVWLWEQGFVATEFAGDATFSLPSQRYFYPIFDGLPGGLLGYDWGLNPCEFATAHFGGLQYKPNDDDARALTDEILRRHRATEA